MYALLHKLGHKLHIQVQLSICPERENPPITIFPTSTKKYVGTQ